MAEEVLRLDTDDVQYILEAVDPVAVVAEELIKGAIDHPDRKSAPLTPSPDEDHVRLDASVDLSCTMPATALRMAHAAALAALATRELLAPGGITVAMLGTRNAIQAQLAVLARHVPDIVHVAVRVTDGGDTGALEPWLLDQLDLAGIGLSMVSALGDSLFGANLVVVVSEGALTDGVDKVHHLVHGTVLVNASGADLPTHFVDHADQLYVDDLALLADNPDRYVVARHLARPVAGKTWASYDRRPPAISADLGRLLAGAHPGRRQRADIVVVELLSVHSPNTHLAHVIAETALRTGRGERTAAPTQDGA